jgi:hypothetical protein
MSKEIWVTDDGSYGFGEIEKFNTKFWDRVDWAAFEEAPDEDKIKVARIIDAEVYVRLLKEDSNG